MLFWCPPLARGALRTVCDARVRSGGTDPHDLQEQTTMTSENSAGPLGDYPFSTLSLFFITDESCIK